MKTQNVVANELTPAQVDEIIARARRGDKTVIPQLRSLLNGNPPLWVPLGNLARHNDAAWIRLICGDDLMARVSLERYLDSQRAQLVGPNPNKLEATLAERVTSCWMQVQHSEAELAASAGKSLAQSSYLLKRADSANRRYATSVKLLATYQQLTANRLPAATDKRAEADQALRLPEPVEQPAPANNGTSSEATNAPDNETLIHEEILALAAQAANSSAGGDTPAEGRPATNGAKSNGHAKRMPRRHKSSNGKSSAQRHRYEPINRVLLVGSIGERDEIEGDDQSRVDGS